MPCGLVRISAELGKYDGFVTFSDLYGLEIDVQAHYVALAAFEPARRRVDKAGSIQLFQPAVLLCGAELPPALVEYRIIAYRRVLLHTPHRFLHPAHEFTARFGAAVHKTVAKPLYPYRRQCGVAKERVIPVVHHVLKYDHAEAVAGVIVKLGLDLYMLAQGIEAELLHCAYVRVEAVG